MKAKWVKTVTPFGTNERYMTVKDQIWDFLIKWMFRAFYAIAILFVIGVFAAYFYTCVPFWFKTLLEAPLICIGAK